MLAPVSSTPSPTLFVQVKKALPIVLLIISVAAAVFALYRLWIQSRVDASSQHDARAIASIRSPNPATPLTTAPQFESEDLRGPVLHGAKIWRTSICGVAVSIHPLTNRDGHFNDQALPSSTDSNAYLAHLRKSHEPEVTLHLQLDDSMFNHEGCLDTGVNAFLAARTYIAERQRAGNHLKSIRIYWLIGRLNGFPTSDAHLAEFRRRLNAAFQNTPT